MHSKLVGVLSLIALVLTLFWAVMIIWGLARGDVVETFDQALEYAQDRGALYQLTYVDAVLITVAVTMLFGALYATFRPVAPAWSAIGIVFIPVYSAFNLFVYASQITVVPQLVELRSTSGSGAEVDVLLGQMVQAWPGSAIGILNGLAYAVVGIPSVIFGLLLMRGDAMMRAAGALLVLNAIACFAGPIGLVTGIPALELGTVIGGFLFLLALVPLSVAFLRVDAGAEPAA